MIDRIPGFDGGSTAQQAEQLKERAAEMSADAQERLSSLANTVRDYTHHQPARPSESRSAWEF